MEQASEPMMKMTALKRIVFRRPKWLEKKPLTAAPSTAPHSKALTMNSRTLSGIRKLVLDELVRAGNHPDIEAEEKAGKRGGESDEVNDQLAPAGGMRVHGGREPGSTIRPAELDFKRIPGRDPN